jgi:hypothetical protein
MIARRAFSHSTLIYSTGLTGTLGGWNWHQRSSDACSVRCQGQSVRHPPSTGGMPVGARHFTASTTYFSQALAVATRRKTPSAALYRTNGHDEKRSRIRIRAQIAANAEMEATSKPSAKIDQPCVSR